MMKKNKILRTDKVDLYLGRAIILKLMDLSLDQAGSNNLNNNLDNYLHSRVTATCLMV